MATNKGTSATTGPTAAAGTFGTANNPKTIRLPFEFRFTGEGEVAPLVLYAFSHGSKLLASAPLDKSAAVLTLPAELNGRTLEVVLGPPTPKGGPAPDLASLVRAGAWRDRVRAIVERVTPVLTIPIAVLPLWCICLVRGRLVKRFTLPNGSVAERPVCNTRVHVCEVDRVRILIERLPELQLHRVRDDLLARLREVVRNPIPQPGPGPVAARGIADAGIEAASASTTALASSTARIALPVEQQIAVAALAKPHSVTHLRSTLQSLAHLLPYYLCEWQYLWSWLSKDCVLTLHGDHQGRFNGWLFHHCKDQPDLYFWVEQFRNGVWTTVYKPSLGCGTYWNYVCGTEIVLNMPGADACEEPGYEVPPGVTLFVAPWAIGNTGIWGIPLGAPAAPQGMLRADGLVNYDAGSTLGMLQDSPFGSGLTFIHDDSWFIPSGATPIRYYRYSYRRWQAAPNTGPADSSWTPMLASQSRGYRLEYSDRLPTYQAFPVGPTTVGGREGLFLFKPQLPPNPGGTVVASEWTNGNLSEAAAYWNTHEAAPGMSETNVSDDAGTFQVKIEVFDAAGNQVLPGAATFQFINRNEAGTDTRLSTAAEVVAGAYVMKVHIDNNPVECDLPQPTIDGVGPNPNCGFIRYSSGDEVRLRYRAAHPNNRAVFGFGVIRGSNGLDIASTPTSRNEVAAASVPTGGSNYVLQLDGYYSQDFTPEKLVGPCINAAFSATVAVYGKAMNGYERIGYDGSKTIAFALAETGV